MSNTNISDILATVSHVSSLADIGPRELIRARRLAKAVEAPAPADEAEAWGLIKSTREREAAPPAPRPKPKPAPKPAPTGGLDAAIAAIVRAEIAGADIVGALDEARVIELVREHAAPVTRVEIVTPDQPDPVDIGVQHNQFPRLLELVSLRTHTYLPGPAGSGKSTAGAMVAKALRLPFYSTGAIAEAYDLLGYVDGNGLYHRTPFRDAFEHGGVFLADELDGSSPTEAVRLNNHFAAAPGDMLPFPDGMIACHADFVLIASANTYGNGRDRQYVGRYQMDSATMDRFAVLDWPYDEGLERAIAGNDSWTYRVQALRRAVAACELLHIVSPRASIKGAKMLAAGIPQPDVERMLIWAGMSANDQERVEAAIDCYVPPVAGDVVV